MQMISKDGTVCTVDKSQVSLLLEVGFKHTTADALVEAAVKAEKAAEKTVKAKK